MTAADIEVCTIWIPEVNAFDYTPAEAFGTIRVMKIPEFTAGAGASADRNRDIVHLIRKQLSDYVPMQDYLLMTGSMLLVSAVSLVLREFGDRHRYLRWDGKYYRYVPYEVDVSKT